MLVDPKLSRSFGYISKPEAEFTMPGRDNRFPRLYRRAPRKQRFSCLHIPARRAKHRNLPLHSSAVSTKSKPCCDDAMFVTMAALSPDLSINPRMTDASGAIQPCRAGTWCYLVMGHTWLKGMGKKAVGCVTSLLQNLPKYVLLPFTQCRRSDGILNQHAHARLGFLMLGSFNQLHVGQLNRRS